MQIVRWGVQRRVAWLRGCDEEKGLGSRVISLVWDVLVPP